LVVLRILLYTFSFENNPSIVGYGFNVFWCGIYAILTDANVFLRKNDMFNMVLFDLMCSILYFDRFNNVGLISNVF
jgi:hypothetical protein